MKRLKKPLIKFVAVLVVYAVLFAVGMSGSNCVTAKAENVQKNTEQKETKKTGWIKKGKYTYYRMKDGKLCRNKIIWVDGKRYYFNKKGRMQKGIVSFSKNSKAYFDEKDGHLICYGMNLTVKKRNYNYVDAKDAAGELFSGISLNNLVNKKEKRIPLSKVRKGSIICAWYTDGIMETYPLQLGGVIKVTLLK